MSRHRCGRTGSALFGTDTESGNEICSSATTWVDCGLVGMYFPFYINLSFSAVNILERPVAQRSRRELASPCPSRVQLHSLVLFFVYPCISVGCDVKVLNNRSLTNLNVFSRALSMRSFFLHLKKNIYIYNLKSLYRLLKKKM